MLISKSETFILIIIAVLYVCLVKYYHIAPISNFVSAALFGWELADYI